MSGYSRAADRQDIPVEAIYLDLQKRVFFPPHLGEDPQVLAWRDEQLRDAFLPPRPPKEFEQARRIWDETLQDLKLVPFRGVREFFRIGTRARQKTRRHVADEKSGNWSGALLQIPDGWSCQSLYASWLVPVAQPGIPSAPLAGDHTWHGSSWIGLDGSLPGSITLPQTGSAHCVERKNNNAAPVASLWWQWWIADDTKNVPLTLPIAVVPGDRVTALLSVRSETRVNFFLKNLESGVSISIDVDAPSSGSFPPEPIEQKTMEWIVERQTEIDGDELLPFADYKQCCFESCIAILLDPKNNVVTMDTLEPVTLEMVDWADPIDPGRGISTYTEGSFDSVRVEYER